MRTFLLLVIPGLLTGAAAPRIKLVEPSYHLIPGSVPLDTGPDGNSVFLDAPKGLILVDTGRHPDHAQKLIDYAKQRGRPVAAIVNTHWHLDHTTGNLDIRQAFPKAQVYATNAIDGALPTFLANGRNGAEARLKDPKTPPARLPEIRRFLALFIDSDHTDYATEAAGYYLDTRLCSSAEEQQKYCRPLK